MISERLSHDPSTTLLWSDVAESSSDSFLLRLRQPKSGEPCEFLDIFPFEGFNCCPVQALRTLKVMHTEQGSYHPNNPVFSFGPGRNLTKGKLNAILSSLLTDLCSSGNTITGHSFRAGIPSLLATFPDLATSDMIKGWGRWSSECYSRYTRLKLPQKRQIFATITTAVRSSSPPPLRREVRN